MDALASSDVFLFDGFRLDRRAGGLFRRGQGADAPIEIGSRALDILGLLVARAGEIVSKDEIAAAVWPGRVVEDSNLTVQISALRRVLDQGRSQGSCIQTVSRRGYRFVRPVTQRAAGIDAGTPPGSHQQLRIFSPDGVEPSLPLANAHPPELQPSSVTSAERRQLTLMICDLVGATTLASRLDPEDLREIIAAYHRAVGEIIAGLDGSVGSYMGALVLVYFGYPRAHEDDAERAVRAGLGVIDAVGRLDLKSVGLKTCVGIATGLVVVSEGSAQDQSVTGETPYLANRLKGLAEPDTVVIAANTHRLTGGLFEYRDLGAVQVKGIAAPVQAWQVLRPSAVASRFEALRGSALTPLVGREEEIDMLLRRWARATAGEGQVVLISGEPGIGKSRLGAALQQRLSDEAHTRLRYFCSPHHRDSPLHPFIGQLERAAGFAREDPPAAKLDKLEALLAQAGKVDGEAAGLFADLLGLPAEGRYPPLPQDPQRRREMMLSALMAQFKALTRLRPVLMIFEDAHWADSTSLELLDRTFDRLASMPALLVITFRPEYAAPWVGAPHVSALSLSRLAQRETAALVHGITAGKRLPQEILDHIVGRTDGIPLFVEELTKSLLESGLLCEERDGYVLAGPLPPLAIPSSLQDSLMARLDRLAPVKEVVQIGATIGREFSYELLAAVACRSDPELRAALDRLTEAGLVFRRGIPPRALYIFKHSLVQEAAHSTLLRTQRQQLHARIGQVLEEQFPEIAETQSEVLAYHFTEAGLHEIAIGYWQKAGERALMRSANAEAVEHLKHGIALTRSLPSGADRNGKEFALQLLLGPAVRVIRGHSAPETEQAFSRAHDLLDEHATIKERITVLYGLWGVCWARAEHIAGCALAERCVALASRNEDAETNVLAARMMGLSLLLMGRFAEAQQFLERAVDLSSHAWLTDLRFSHDHRVAASTYLSYTLWPLGYPDRAIDTMAQALAMARASGHAMTLAVALCGVSFLFVAFGAADPEQAGALTDEAVAHCTEWRVALLAPLVRFHQAMILAQQGDAAIAVEDMRRARGAAKQASVEFGHSMYLGHLAQTLAKAGQVALARELLDEAVRFAESTHERFFEAELHRMRGELLARLGESGNARTVLERALAVARGQQARMWELRAATSLARLRRDQGHAAEARELLAPIYGWFTEGFATPDLKEAKALLEALVA